MFTMYERQTMRPREDLTVMARLDVTGEKNTHGGRKEPVRYVTFGYDNREAIRQMHQRLSEVIAQWDTETGT